MLFVAINSLTQLYYITTKLGANNASNRLTYLTATTFAGATILGDGEVALILDIAQLIALGQPHEETLRAAG